jgi:hypothetical protein
VTDEAVKAEADTTWVLRNSDYPFWVSLRQRLAEQGIDYESTSLVESFEEGPTAPGAFEAEEVGVLITGDGRLLEYRYSYNREAWLTWADITQTWRTSRHADAIENVLLRSE